MPFQSAHQCPWAAGGIKHVLWRHTGNTPRRRFRYKRKYRHLLAYQTSRRFMRILSKQA